VRAFFFVSSKWRINGVVVAKKAQQITTKEN